MQHGRSPWCGTISGAIMQQPSPIESASSPALRRSGTSRCNSNNGTHRAPLIEESAGLLRGTILANQKHLRMLQRGAHNWNAWRKANRSVQPDLRDADLSNAHLRDADLSNADLNHAKLIGANLVSADLSNANLNHVSLISAKLIGADLSNADLLDANLRNADLRNADLRQASLINADLRGADLSNADVSNADLSN